MNHRGDSGTCPWCGGYNHETCLCGGCVTCGWYHDGGPPRSGRVIRVVKWLDGLVHAVTWERGIFTITVCWAGMNHVDPYPVDSDFEATTEHINCLECLAEV